MKAKVNGIELAYEILGQAGHPIVLIHGFGLNHTIWMEMAEKYLRNHRVILPDVRGHGNSDAPAEVYKMSLLAKDIVLLLEYLGINKATVCGHSMGGYITLAFAEKFPERLAGMGLITTHSKADSDEKRKERYLLVEEVCRRGSSVVADSLSPRLTHDDKIAQAAYDMIAATAPDGIVGALKGMVERPDRTEILSRITVPSLVVAGEDDQLINPDDANGMADALSQSEFLALSGAGHLPMIETPDKLGEGINRLIRRIKDVDPSMYESF